MIKRNRKNGDILISVLVFAAIAVTVTVGLANWGASMLAGIRTVQAKEQAFQIAEAGIDYYRWHLAQYPTDYKDGTTTPAPYYHNFYDKNDNFIGQYSLTITPPPVGSTKVVITSTGTTTAAPTVKRVVQAALAQPSLAQYAVVANDQMVFGSGTTVYGPITSNRGIHFDGLAHNVISSALATDTDPDQDSGSCSPYPKCAVEWGVWTEVPPADPQPSTALNNHNGDVFLAGRQNSVSAFPFGSLAVNLNTLHTLANGGVAGGACTTASGPCWKSSGSGNFGYYIHLNTNGTYDIYKVTALQSSPNNCTNDASENQWGTWSYQTLSSKIGTYSIPSNGVIFVEDNLWVDGTNVGQSTTTSRVTIATAANTSNMSSTTGSNIILNNDLTYARYDGSVVVGLIAQSNVLVGLVSDDNLQVDAALVAESGHVGRDYYNTHCTSGGTNYWHRTSLILNGMIGTDFRYGFQWTGSNNYNCGGSVGQISSGYCTRSLNYDPNLLYSPPPNFPLASTQYQMAYWKQLQ